MDALRWRDSKTESRCEIVRQQNVYSQLILSLSLLPPSLPLPSLSLSLSQEEKERSKKNYRFIVSGYDELPADVHKSIERMGVGREAIERDFEAFLSVLSFADKHIPKRK
jgi:hypothetical protein